ncbi:lytic transglycosylase domain-containing protein [Paracoccus spongiarum]|uniref:Transglycosylase SLT domain-containing protein n=1 Tax=Paracoccus spongiarum TaxID=3064387 RepID=A0ABT9JFE6_9RHOB|nr:transglycosylase SLT domain-containing protein [Paracoccus sp. 2205BS29-5]MDP5308543.1 transglycosylase SLT domain-containing protein [Paracoccus sp. 2205BS29-5]
MQRLLAMAALIATMLAQPAMSRPAVDAHLGRPPPARSEALRCTDDGRDCIGLGSYVADVCKLIERNAGERGLDPNFVARLLWKESRFEPGAISPAGAQGIAQFMPGTADLYDLDDPFNPALAIHKSAWYLAHLRDMFGNIGMAAIAYNGGENRAARFLAGQGGLPYETLDYVEAITGFNAYRWRDNPPGLDDLRISLKPDTEFRPACEEMAGNRSLREFIAQQRVYPWGVIVASHPSQSVAAQQVARLNRTLRPVLGGKRVGYVRKKLTGMPRAVYTAQVGYDSKSEATAFCLKLKRVGGRCIVLKN